MMKKVETAVFNYKDICKRLGGDADIIKMVVDTFRKNVAQNIEKVKTALEEKDASAVQMHGHTIKGSAGNTSADQISKIGLKLEIAGEQKELDKVPLLIDEINCALERFNREIDDLGI